MKYWDWKFENFLVINLFFNLSPKTFQHIYAVNINLQWNLVSFVVCDLSPLTPCFLLSALQASATYYKTIQSENAEKMGTLLSYRGKTLSATILRKAVAFKRCSVVTKWPNIWKENTPTPWHHHKPELLILGRMDESTDMLSCGFHHSDHTMLTP